MDGRGFDDFTRKLGRGASRRSVLKGLAAGLGIAFVGKGPVKALAQESCETIDDCPDGFTCEAGICVAVGGECKVEGGECTVTENCCDGLFCTGLVCSAPCGGEGTACGGEGATCCDGFTCENEVCAGVHLCLEEGAVCADTQECCVNLFCNLGHCDGTCSGQENTCGNEGDRPCCDSLECVESLCAPVTCSEIGGDCETSDDCCNALVCDSGTCFIPCQAEGAICEISDDCCNGLVCSGGLCSVPCGIEGETCESDDDCCSGSKCHWGTCKSTCGFPGDACEMVADNGCCPGLTCFEAVCDNPSGLCLDKGEFCDDKNFLCCDGLVCHRHTCKAPKPHPAPAPTTPATSATVTTLPSTGNGPDDSSGSVWLGAAALGGMAAFIAAKRMHEKTDANDN